MSAHVEQGGVEVAGCQAVTGVEHQLSGYFLQNAMGVMIFAEPRPGGDVCEACSGGDFKGCRRARGAERGAHKGGILNWDGKTFPRQLEEGLIGLTFSIYFYEVCVDLLGGVGILRGCVLVPFCHRTALGS